MVRFGMTEYAGVLLLGCQLVHSWVLDPVSCGPRADKTKNPPEEDKWNDKVRIAMDSAFGMMSRADAVLRDWGNADDNFKNLFGYLFRDPNRPAVTEVFHNFTMPRTVNERPSYTDNYKKDINEIIIYCDMRRIEERRRGANNEFQLWWDNDIDEPLEKFDDENQQCMDPGTKGGLMAYTLSGKGTRPSQIQLCNWYLKKMLDTDRKNPSPYQSKDTNKQKVLAWLTNEVWRKLPLTKTMIDTWGLLDLTIAHEFTHTWRNGETNIFDGDRKRKEQYEWADITKIDWGHENADNYAYFAIGVRLIQDPNPFIVQKDGSLKAKDSKPPRRWVPNLDGIPWRA